jgi:hypothetical protein
MSLDYSDKATRRQVLAAAGAAGLFAASPGVIAAAAKESSGKAAAPGIEVAPSILDYLADLRSADQTIAETWCPDDPSYRADMYQQMMMNLSFAYFAYFQADPEHPDWAPLWNPVYRDQPNPDDIYFYAPVRGDLTYRVSGNRGTCRLLIFSTQTGLSGLVDNPAENGHHVDFDDRALNIGPDGEFAILFSAEHPAGFSGNWGRMDPRADNMMVRCRMWDWTKERDPQLSIECLSPVPLKPRLTPEQIIDRIKEMAKFPGRANKFFLGWQNAVKQHVGFNVFEPARYPGMSKQVYWPAVFRFNPDEALIIETEMPKTVHYWNIQLNDPYFNALEYVYRLSSINGSTAKIGSDGKLRAVISLEDPGVPNWLDPAGYTEGGIYGRWYDADTSPTPIINRVPLAKLRKYLPHDTATVTKEERATQLRERVRAAQRRRRW